MKIVLMVVLFGAAYVFIYSGATGTSLVNTLGFGGSTTTKSKTKKLNG